MKILNKKATDLTVGETIGLSLGLCVLGFVPYVITMIMESDCFKKEEKEEPPMEITAIDEEETSD